MLKKQLKEKNPILLTSYLLQTVMLLVMLFLAFLTARAVETKAVGPINQLAEGARDYAAFGNIGDNSEESIFERIVIDTGDEIEELRDTMVEMEAEINKALKTIKESAAREERIATELDLAKNIQLAALPKADPAFPDEDRFELYATMHPAKEVGGDFYDFFMTDSDHLAMVIADVSGKGVPAALFMMVSKAILKNITLHGGKPSEIISMLNDNLCEDDLNDMFVTIWLGILDLNTGEMQAVNAGHEYPFITGESGDYNLYKDPHGLVVGAISGVKYKDYTITLHKGDRLFVYTDGVAEAQNSEDELFGTDRIKSSLNQHKEDNPRGIVQHIKSDVDSFAGEIPQFDDITMLSLWYKG